MFLTASCSERQKQVSHPAEGNLYATHFSIQKSDHYSILTVSDPWQNATGTAFRYILQKKDAPVPDSLSALPVIHVPVRKVVVFSTTHVGFISALGEDQTIRGVSGLDFIYDAGVRKGISAGRVQEIGYTPAVDYERILEIKPDLALLYGLNPSVTAISDRLAKAGIPSVIIAEYLERHPLGKMEWLKVFSAFYGKETQAGTSL